MSAELWCAERLSRVRLEDEVAAKTVQGSHH